MPTPEKATVIQEAETRLKDVQGVYLADFSGLSVEKMTQLRSKCRAEGIHFKVIKNTLLKRAFHTHGITQLDDYLVGNTGLVFSPTSETTPAKVLSDFAKDNEQLRVKAAVVNGRLFDDKAVARLAALPSREVLLGQVIGTFVAPMTQFLAVVEAVLRLPAGMTDALHREKSKAS